MLYIGQLIPPVSPESQPPWQVINLGSDLGLPDGSSVSGSVELFQLIYATTTGAVFASMMAYIAAQYVDVRLFHFWKGLTKGKHLWLRNNFSTMTSQLVDSIMVVLVTFRGAIFRGDMGLGQVLTFIFSNYLFKFFSAALDTPLIYLLVWKLKPYLGIKDEYDEQAKTVS